MLPRHWHILRSSLLVVVLGLWLAPTAKAQSPAPPAFHGTRVLSSHSAELLDPGILEFLISHRFGNIAGPGGGWNNFFGLDEAQDIRYGIEYGLHERLMIGIGRTKGAYQRRVNLESFAKLRLLQQTDDDRIPLTATLLLGMSFTTAPASSDSTAISSFPKFVHRFSYAHQLILSRRFGSGFSLALMPTFVHRNFVLAGDANQEFALGVASRIRVTKHFAVLVEYFQPFHSLRKAILDYHPPLGLGFEFTTGGHIFLLNMTNSRSLNMSELIANGESDWLAGEFRYGFTISRQWRMRHRNGR